jgi:small subunit ribosomal protein S21|tara:strand:+ start:243 stop:560 length:318 start_codon:yes stop_codon:yes gene_type:complete
MAYNRTTKHHHNNTNRDRFQKPKRQFTPDPPGLAVAVREGEDVNKALRRLKKKIESDGLFNEIRERQHYTKPSEKRKIAKAAAKARWKRKERDLDIGPSTPKRRK